MQNGNFVLSDPEIVDLYWARNEDAIKHTDIKYRRYLLTVAQNILQDLQDSEECLNDTYLRTWNSIPPSRPHVLQAFLTTIARRSAIDLYRKKVGRSDMPKPVMVPLEDFENMKLEDDGTYSAQECNLLADVIGAYVKQLSQRTRYVFVSRYYFAWPIEQIAKKLGCSQATVHREIAYIKSSLREYLAKEGYTV